MKIHAQLDNNWNVYLKIFICLFTIEALLSENLAKLYVSDVLVFYLFMNEISDVFL